MKARLQRKLQIAEKIERQLQIARQILFAERRRDARHLRALRRTGRDQPRILARRSSSPEDCADSATARAKNAAGCRRCAPVRPPARAPRRHPAAPAPWSPAPSHPAKTRRAARAPARHPACCRSRRWPDRAPKANRAPTLRPPARCTDSASSSASMPSCTQISRMRSIRSLKSTERKLKCWQREAMVAGILCDSVVHRMKTAHGGGSSMVFSSALKASLVI